MLNQATKEVVRRRDGVVELCFQVGDKEVWGCGFPEGDILTDEGLVAAIRKACWNGGVFTRRHVVQLIDLSEAMRRGV